MKKILFLFLFLGAGMLVNMQKAQASHGAGAEIIYEHISDSTYRFFFKFYRDCTGAPAPGSFTLCCFNPCLNLKYDSVLKLYQGLIPPGKDNGKSVSAGCSKFKNKCDSPGSSLPGYEEWWYTADVTLYGQCDSWKFAVWMNARNPQNNILNAGAQNLYVETTFDNLNAQGNSSPYFSNKPIPYCCLNQFYSYNNGAVDPNTGDSLTSEVINPLTGTSCQTLPTPLTMTNPVGYPPILFPTNPLQSANTFVINTFTGQLSFIPTQAGPSTLTIRTKEWRNGKLIGSIMRDVQVQVLQSCSFGLPSITQPSNIINGIWVNNQVQTCVETPLSFTFDLKSSDTEAVIVATDNHDVAVPGSTVTYTNMYTDSVRGLFTWTPTLNQTGTYTLTVTHTDSTCRPPGILLSQTYSIPIYVFGRPKASNDTSVCPGDPVQLSVHQAGVSIGLGNFTWTINNGPAGSLSCTNCQFPIASAYGDTRYIVTSNTTAFCSNNKDTVEINMLPGPKFTQIPDIITCLGTTHPVNLNLENLPGVSYDVKWTPGSYLSSSAIPNPVITPLGDVTYHIVIEASDNACKSFDTMSVDVLDGFRILTGDTAICVGDKVQVNVVGDSRYTFSWIPLLPNPDPSGNTSISNTAIMNPEFAPPVPGKWRYQLTAKYLNCPDTTADFDIVVQPIPVVTLPDDLSVCHGDTVHLSSKVSPDYEYTYSWTPGVSLNNAKVPAPIFKARETETLKLTASTSAGCKHDDEMTIIVFPADFLELSSDTSICPRDTAQLRLNGNGLTAFSWDPDKHISNTKTLTPNVWPVTTQIYQVYAVDTSGCHDTAEVKVVVKPGAVVDLPEVVNLYPGQSYNMEPKGNGLYFSWFPHVGLSNPNISNPVMKPEVDTRYIVRATTEFGCFAIDSVDVKISDSQLDVPNVFAPRHSSTLKVVHIGDARLRSFAIYNRWGAKVFETNDINKGWDGTYNGKPQPLGVYVYTLDAETYTGKRVTKQGNITVIR
jgi:gliding motility-associated-like protein